MGPNDPPQTFAAVFSEDPIALGVFVATIVILITFAIYWTLGRNRGFRQHVLLIGLSGSGKTALFSRLVASKHVESYTSMKENAAVYNIKEVNKTVKLVDIPGNDRLRSKFLDKYKNMSRGVIFVVDSLNFPREIKEVAEIIYATISDRLLSQGNPQILVCCNKQDEAMAKSGKVIQSQLEKEINTVRMTRSAQLDAVGDSSLGQSVFIGKRGKDFEFSDLRPLKVEFADASVKEGSLDSVRKWIQCAA